MMFPFASGKALRSPWMIRYYSSSQWLATRPRRYISSIINDNTHISLMQGLWKLQWWKGRCGVFGGRMPAKNTTITPLPRRIPKSLDACGRSIASTLQDAFATILILSNYVYLDSVVIVGGVESVDNLMPSFGSPCMWGHGTREPPRMGVKC
jgi:hypothetical protein